MYNLSDNIFVRKWSAARHGIRFAGLQERGKENAKVFD